MKVCSESGCPEIQTESRCPAHTRARDQARGTRAERGYGAEHDALRAKWAPRVALGIVRCWRCGDLLMPHEPFDLGHDDHDRTQYRGPEHVACNRATAGRRATPPARPRDGALRPPIPSRGIPRRHPD